MTLSRLSRRAVLLLPLAFAACGEEEPQTFEPLTWDYLPPIKLNVATVTIEDHFVPSGTSADLSRQAPVPPLTALHTMIEQRLRPFGTTGRAVVAIQDATLARSDDTISGSMAIVLTIYGENGARAGFIEARVAQRYAGRASSLRAKLYEMVKSMMDRMNVEVEFQVRRHLRDWITTGTAAATAVEQTPLDSPTRR